MPGERDRASCPACGARYTRGEGARVSVSGTSAFSGEVDPAELVDRIDAMGGPFPAFESADGSPRHESVALRRTVVDEEPVRDRGRLMGFAEKLGPPVPGLLAVDEAEVRFLPDGEGAAESTELADLRSIQSASSTLQLRERGGVTVSFRFPSDSPRRWEALLRHLVARRWEREGRGPLVEYQPCFTTAADASGEAPRALGEIFARRGWKPPRTAGFYRVARWLASGLARARVDLRVVGVGNVPTEGAFVLAVAHGSILDPLFVLVACPRPVYTLTKSTQFGSAGWRHLLLRLQAFPTRRYRVDPQAVRTALRVIGAGEGLGIFPEGERSWDGRSQALRRGAVRLMMASGATVVPCAVDGSYAVLPRWSHRAARGRRVTVRFGPPVDLREGAPETGKPRHGEGDAVTFASRRLSRALRALSTDLDGDAG